MEIYYNNMGTNQKTIDRVSLDRSLAACTDDRGHGSWKDGIWFVSRVSFHCELRYTPLTRWFYTALIHLSKNISQAVNNVVHIGN